MSTLKLSRCRVEELITHATIIGRLVPENAGDYMKLVRLAWSFRRVVNLMVREVANDTTMKDATKKLYSLLPNYIYLETAYKHAKLVVKGCRFNNGNPRHVHVRKLFIISRGSKWDRGNRNIKLILRREYFTVLIKYPWDSSWIKCRAFFGGKYISLLRELIELSRMRIDGYGARIVFRNRRLELHVSVPLHLYLKHFSMSKRRGYGLVAGLDLNSDRLNMVVIDSNARIVALKTAWLPEVTLHGFSRDKARNVRLKKLRGLLSYARRIGVNYIVFENLLVVKKRSKVGSPSGNRKITRFAKKQLLQHGLLMTMKLCLTPILVNPKGTTHSCEHKEVMKSRGAETLICSFLYHSIFFYLF